MDWLVFSYSLPSKSQSSRRVALWRRLRRIGALSLKTGLYILPAREECVEAFQWLAQEVQQAKGEALVVHTQLLEGLTDTQIIEQFRQSRQQEYAEIETQADQLAKTIKEFLANPLQPNSESQKNSKETLSSDYFSAITKLRKRHSEILQIDFFDCPKATQVASQLLRLEQIISVTKTDISLTPAAIAEYQNRCWITRPRPYVDRLACAWLIRRFIDCHATICYSGEPKSDEIAFDMKDAEFGHQGNLCSFETMLLRFDLKLPGLNAIAAIVHELDLRDSQSIRPETAGVERILQGWRLAGLSDEDLEARGRELFEGLYIALCHQEESC